jgi:high affinity Mn2+ porin
MRTKNLRLMGAFPVLILGLSVLAPAQSSSTEQAVKEKTWSVHFQLTVISQWHPPFSAPYSGARSLRSGTEIKTSLTTTLFLGVRLWRGGELYANPEASAGQGFSNVTGIAGFPNGEIYRVSTPAPRFYPARLYLKQTFDLGGPEEDSEDGPNQIAGRVPVHRLTLVAGKFCLTDFFDNNAFSHDPRIQFMNWSLMNAGAWDFAADTHGYTWGGLTEWAAPKWAARLAAVMVPTTANGMKMDTHIAKAFSLNFELERRYDLGGQQGAVRLMLFRNAARMGSYREAVDNPAYETDITLTEEYGRAKYGFGLNWEQALSANAGLFARLSWNDGHTETWAFTEIDRSLSVGTLASGKSWGRPKDRCGAALVVNGLSRDHADYLAAGGYGFIIGDGRLRYGLEAIGEAFYCVSIIRGIWLSADYQFVLNPAYNRDRGPVHVVGVRLHTEI